MSIIRFRTVVRDARDTAYIFLSLICGMAAGFGFYGAALIGSATVNLIAVYLHLTGFGAWYSGEGLLRFRVASSMLGDNTLEAQLAKFCRRFSVISVDETTSPEAGGEQFCQCAYKVRLRESGLRRCYWLNVQTLSERLLRPGQALVATKYFTARITGGRARSPFGSIAEPLAFCQYAPLPVLLDNLESGHFTTCLQRQLIRFHHFRIQPKQECVP